MRTVYYTASTLDGFLADEHDSLDWLLKQPQSERGPDAFDYNVFIEQVGALVMGRTTYQWGLDHHTEIVAETGSTWPWSVPAYVMTHAAGLLVPEGADVTFASGDVRDVHSRLVAAAGGRDVWVVGGGDLAGQFADAGLLDEIVVTMAPVTVGAGRPLLPRRYDLELLETGVDAGFVCARYRVIGVLT